MKITEPLSFPNELVDLHYSRATGLDQQANVGRALLANEMVDRGAVVDWLLDGSCDQPHQTLCDALNDIAAGESADRYTSWFHEAVWRAATHADEIPTDIWFDLYVLWDGDDPCLKYNVARVEIAGVEVHTTRMDIRDFHQIESAVDEWCEGPKGAAWLSTALEPINE